MRPITRPFLLAVFAVLALPHQARAGDKPLVAPAPAWVEPAPALAFKDVPRSGNVLPRFDEQVLVDGDTTTVYIDTVKVVSSGEILNKLGTVTAGWQPQHGDLTFHAIEIWRDGQVIDALQGGAGITVLRREAGLERLEVDGALTAVKHLEGLRIGDVLRVSFSLTERDPVLQGHVQDALVLIPRPVQMSFGRARLVWPQAMKLDWKVLAPGVEATPQPIAGGRQELVIPLPIAKLPESPKNMPARCAPMPVIEFTNFADWREVAAVMTPLFAAHGTIREGSDLARAVDAIAAKSPDPLHRMADALELVQNEVRYQLIALGTGNYVPQAPMDTWAKRYGDCKAKTLLLLAVLDRLGIEAEPVLANSRIGDALGQMPPSAMAFDHVFVRARLAGESYWLDGTMLGSRLADIHDAPHMGYVLPLHPGSAALELIPSRAHARPDLDAELTSDMSGGPHLPAPFHLVIRYQGPFGESTRVDPGGDYDERLKTFAEKAAKNWLDSETIARPMASYDAEHAIWTLAVDGVSYPDWQFRDGHYQLALQPSLRVDFDAPRDKSTWRTIPAVIDRPWTAHSRLTIHLPDAGKGAKLDGGEPAALALPAVDWQRSAVLSGSDFVEEVSSRETGAEIAPEAISAAGKAIADAMGRKVHVDLAASYPQRWDDVARMRGGPAMARVKAVFDQRIADKPDGEASDRAGRYADRGWFEARLLDWAASEEDYGKAIALDPTATRYLARTDIRQRRGDHAGALKDAQAAYDLEQGNKDARNNLADELAEAGKVDEALDLLDANADLATDDGISAFLERIDVLETGNRHDEALGLLGDALDKHPGSAPLHNARCWYNGLRGTNLDGALADCNRAIELASNPAGYLDSRALVHFRAGRLKQAAGDYQAALAEEPEQASSLFMAGIVLGKLGQSAKASADLAAARAVLPNIDHFYSRFGIKP